MWFICSLCGAQHRPGFLIRSALSERGFASHGEPALTICF